MKDHSIVTKRAESLTEALFSLEEPWRSRFLTLVAKQATRWTWEGTWSGHVPTREEVASWLDDRGLCRSVTTLLYAWHVEQKQLYPHPG